MNVKVDFKLNSQYSPVEKLIFRLVLNGFSNVVEIRHALPIFSDDVIANSIRRLVNQQIITIRNDKINLSISDTLCAIIEQCLVKKLDIHLPDSFQKCDGDDVVVLFEGNNDKEKNVKKAILNELLPGVKIDQYVNVLDLVLFECE